MKKIFKLNLQLHSAENLKSLIEQRNDKVTEIQSLVSGAKAEVRAMNDEEMTKFTTLETEIASIDATIKAETRAKGLEIIEDMKKSDKTEERAVEEAEERAFDGYIRGVISENRATNLEKSTNGAIIPKTIAKKIIETVKDLSTIYNRATRYNVKGELVFPVYDEATQKVTCAYQTEFTALTSNTGKFTSISLTGYLAGALAKVSLSLVNNSEFDLVNYVIMKVAESIAEFLEKELLVGTDTKMTGLLSSSNSKVAAAATAITSDELVSLKLKVKKRFQKNAIWIMHPDTYEVVAKMKDGQGNYLVINDFTTGFEPRILGKEVEISENMPTMVASAKTIAYGDMSGLSVKLTENINIQVLQEKYADEHAIGVIGWVEADSKITEPQKIAVLAMAAL